MRGIALVIGVAMLAGCQQASAPATTNAQPPVGRYQIVHIGGDMVDVLDTQSGILWTCTTPMPTIEALQVQCGPGKALRP